MIDRLSLLGITEEEAQASDGAVAACFTRSLQLRDRIAEVPVDQSRTPRLTYVVAMTYRSGSTLLKDWLIGTGVMGKPEEYLNTRPGNLLDQWAAAFRSADIASYLRCVGAHHVTPNGVFGIKAEFMQYLPAIRSGAFDDVDPRPRFIYLERRDLMAQAVSLARARATGKWNSSMPIRLDGDLDEFAVAECMFEITRSRGLWERFFALTGAEPLRLTYEEMVAQPSTAVSRVADHLGVELPEPMAPLSSSLEVQRDAVSAEWMGRIRGLFEKGEQ